MHPALSRTKHDGATLLANKSEQSNSLLSFRILTATDEKPLEKCLQLNLSCRPILLWETPTFRAADEFYS